MTAHALHGGSLPDGLFSGGRDALLCQRGGDGICGFPLKELAVDAFDDLRFFRDDLRQSVGTFAVAQELAVRDADLTVGEPFPLSPGDILGNGTALLLSQTGHDGDEQFALGVEGHDVFFLEKALTAGFLQLADGGQAVHGISRESAHTLGHNQVDFSGQGIPDHAVEAVPALGVDGADALISVDLHEVPVGVLLDVVAFLAGGEVAARITSWIMSGYFPVLFVLNIIFCVIGLLNVYLIGDRGFRFDTSTSATREK